MPSSAYTRSPLSPSEAIARTEEPLYGRSVPSTSGATVHRWRLRGRLLGGGADGHSVQLDSLMDTIAVYLVDGAVIGCDRALPHRGEGRFIGVYRLATGTGPEPPVYVSGV